SLLPERQTDTATTRALLMVFVTEPCEPTSGKACEDVRPGCSQRPAASLPQVAVLEPVSARLGKAVDTSLRECPKDAEFSLPQSGNAQATRESMLQRAARAGREGIARVRLSRLESLLEPAHSLFGSSVREGFGRYIAARLHLKFVIADCGCG